MKLWRMYWMIHGSNVEHDGLSLLRQRLYALALSHEDLNDHHQLCLDLTMQTAIDRDGV